LKSNKGINYYFNFLDDFGKENIISLITSDSATISKKKKLVGQTKGLVIMMLRNDNEKLLLKEKKNSS